ncbi:MAG: CrcB family protein [Acidobacteriaceae bacterium]|nr:CrcB family protein [Acidobacteriaceae bacterium]MBV9297110.1 CrcB family protein [Acidobacteriaceae bacterium]MBV9765707.1 CrcB family protein [Acidobacteriaceae bacterium]
MSKYLIVMLGGALGAVSRFLVGTFVFKIYSGVFPLATFLINVSGSFLIGILMMLFVNRPAINTNWRLFLVTGILGGYTTFSSFEWEKLRGVAGQRWFGCATQHSVKRWFRFGWRLDRRSALQSILAALEKFHSSQGRNSAVQDHRHFYICHCNEAAGHHGLQYRDRLACFLRSFDDRDNNRLISSQQMRPVNFR